LLGEYAEAEMWIIIKNFSVAGWYSHSIVFRSPYTFVEISFRTGSNNYDFNASSVRWSGSNLISVYGLTDGTDKGAIAIRTLGRIIQPTLQLIGLNARLATLTNTYSGTGIEFAKSQL
jgi:hypothetical protein